MLFHYFFINQNLSVDHQDKLRFVLKLLNCLSQPKQDLEKPVSPRRPVEYENPLLYCPYGTRQHPPGAARI